MLELTGERLVPDRQEGELVHAEHLVRYRLAAPLAEGRRVLDAACGEGYGTAMLSAAGAREVTGIDIDRGTVDHARRRYGLAFECADIADLPFADGSFDLVVSFETIEHVAEPERVLAELRRVLVPDGVLVASTPNVRRYLDPNPFHLAELDHDDFVAALRRSFDEVELLFQDNMLVSAVLDARELASSDGEHPLDLELTKVFARRPGEELYAIAICGPVPRPRLVAVATGVYEGQALAHELREWKARAAEAERLVTEWNRRATEAERQVGVWRSRYAEVEGSTAWRLIQPLRKARRRRSAR